MPEQIMIGKYEIFGPLGEGATSVVYLAQDTTLGREVALKVLKPHLASDAESFKYFLREAQTAARLNHPHIAAIHDMGESNGRFFIAMQRIEGQSLNKILHEHGPLPVAETLRMARDVAAALDYAHRRGFLHRDVKPANTLRDTEGKYILTDFGLARALDMTGLTSTNTAVPGTLAYIAPEVWNQQPLTAAVDQYALACVIYEAIDGQTLFQGEPAAIMASHVMHNPQFRPAFTSRVPLAFVNALRIGLDKDPTKRYPNCAAMVDALAASFSEAAAGTAQVVQTPQTAPVLPMTGTAAAAGATMPTAPAPAVRKRRGGVWVLPALLALAALGYFAFTQYGAFLPFAPAVVAGAPATPTSGAEVVPTSTFAPTDTPEPEPTNTDIPAVTEEPTPELPLANAPAAAPTEVPTATAPPPPPVTGGADKLAYIFENNVWVANVDGSGVEQITADGAVKSNLRWLPDGQGVSYISGKCIFTAGLDGSAAPLTCFNNATYLESFEVSPDGQRLALSLDHQMYILPFDPDGLSGADTHADLAALGDCPEVAPYQRNAAVAARWSKDSKMLALIVLGVLSDQRRGEIVQVFSAENCVANPAVRVAFPPPHFTFPDYERNPTLPGFTWDGKFVFVVNGSARNGGFGDLHIFNSETFRPVISLNPIDGKCCYRDPQFSPDGTYLLFAFQDATLGAESQTALYYLPFGSVGTGMVYQPLPLPAYTNPREAPQPVLRPAQP